MSTEICNWLQSWQQEEFEGSPLFISNLAEQIAVLMVTGPRARQVLLELEKDIDLSTTALPHLAAISGTLAGIPTTVVRTAYTGEPTFELHVPADAASYLWAQILDIGRKFDLRALGEEALTRLAAEKGRLDLSTVPDEALGPTDISVHKPLTIKSADFVGKKALGRHSSGTQLQLVALKSESPDDPLPLRGALRQSNGEATEHGGSQGFILTSFMSEALRQRITLALLENGHDRIGETSLFETEAGAVNLHITRPTIFDPNERRRHG
jgi:sarcosine oxidase subunit alpha